MSRSYKKTPIVKQQSRGKALEKRFANKRVRKELEIADGKAYRKVSNTWAISDYASYCSLEEFMGYDHLWSLYQTEEEMEQAWRRSFYLK